MKEKIYLSGGITGRKKEDVLKEFFEKEKQLIDLGCEVINPLRLHGIVDLKSWNKHKQRSYEDYMREGIRSMLQEGCVTIFMLPSSQFSIGAKFELEVAKFLNYEILY